MTDIRTKAILFASALGLATIAAAASPAIADDQLLTAAEAPASAMAFGLAVDRAMTAMVADPETALIAAEEAEDNARGIDDGTARAMWLQSEALTRLGRADEAVPRLSRAKRELTSQDGELAGQILLTEGRQLMGMNQSDLALAAFQDAYRAFQDAGMGRQRAISLQNIALLYQRAHSYEKAMNYYRQASEAFPDDVGLSFGARNNYAKLLEKGGRFEEAREALGVSLAMAMRSEQPSLVAKANLNLVQLSLKQGRLGEAEEHLGAALAFEDDPDAARWAPHVQHMTTRLAMAKGDAATARRAIEALFEGQDLERTGPMWDDAHEDAYAFYKTEGETDLALRHLEALRRISDEAATVALETSNVLASAEFEVSNRELENERLRAEALEDDVALAAARAEVRRTVTAGGFGTAALGFLGVGVYLRSRNALTRSLRETNEKLEVANATQRQFLSNVSHEIRTPLNGVIGMSKAVLLSGRLDEENEEHIKIVHSSGELLFNIVTDILDFSKASEGRTDVDRRPTDIGEVVRLTAALHRANAEAKGIELIAEAEEGLPLFDTDDTLLKQAVGNLASNAVKFTERGEVRIHARRGEGGGFEIAVRDEGIGIAPDAQARVFESFQQADGSTRRKYGGTGLGLSIVREFAQLLGGTIELESTLGRGSTFTLRIPAEASGEEPAEAAPPLASSVRERSVAVTALRPVPTGAGGTVDVTKLRVLYAEDNLVNAKVADALLGRQVESITIAEDGAVAADLVRTGAFDMVLMDKEMPNMDGLEATRAIRALPGVGTIPIIGLTASGDAEVGEEMMAAGMNAVTTKPVRVEDFVEAVRVSFEDAPSPARVRITVR